MAPPCRCVLVSAVIGSIPFFLATRRELLLGFSFVSEPPFTLSVVEHGRAIRERGLTLEEPDATNILPVPCVEISTGPLALTPACSQAAPMAATAPSRLG